MPHLPKTAAGTQDTAFKRPLHEATHRLMAENSELPQQKELTYRYIAVPLQYCWCRIMLHHAAEGHAANHREMLS